MTVTARHGGLTKLRPPTGKPAVVGFKTSAPIVRRQKMTSFSVISPKNEFNEGGGASWAGKSRVAGWSPCTDKSWTPSVHYRGTLEQGSRGGPAVARTRPRRGQRPERSMKVNKQSLFRY